MINLSMAQALNIWSELEQCLHGTNGYGGDIAEIYAHSLQANRPALSHGNPNSDFFKEIQEEVRKQSAASLYAILMYFSEKRDCVIQIKHDDIWKKIGPWIKDMPFHHRCHVQVSLNASNR